VASPTAASSADSAPPHQARPAPAQVADGLTQRSDGLSTCTGTVTVGGHDTQKSTDRRAVYGQDGRMVATHNVGSFRHQVRFRVVTQDGEGRPVQVPVSLSVDEDPVFLKDGDLVTLVGRRTREGLFKAPAIASHAGRFTMMPRRQRIDSIFVVVVVAVATLALLALQAELRTDPSLGVIVNAIWLVDAVIVFLMVRAVWRRIALGRALRQIVAGFGGGWTPVRLVDPCGTVDGVFTYTRGTQSPADWVSFRLALPATDGEPQHWLVAAARQKKLVTDLRMGDVVRLRGEFLTGRIQLPTRIEVVSVDEGGGATP
jgi:hypothetical protein